MSRVRPAQRHRADMDAIFGYADTSQPGLLLHTKDRSRLVVHPEGSDRLRKLVWVGATLLALSTAALYASAVWLPLRFLSWGLFAVCILYYVGYLCSATVFRVVNHPDLGWKLLYKAFGDAVDVEDLLLIRSRVDRSETLSDLAWTDTATVAKAATLLRAHPEPEAVEATAELARYAKDCRADREARERRAAVKALLAEAEERA